MKVLSVVGARPQFVKLSAVARDFDDHNIEHVIVHTGQHYDPMLSDVFFRDLEIPAPDEHLGVGSAGHGQQTGAILALLDEVLLRHQPDWVVVYGDTNSTLAAAISAVKLHFPVAHLEAGLRSFNRRMPEEHNRVLTDHAADLCLAPTELAMSHLASEGLGAISINVGDVMTDVLFRIRNEILPQRQPLALREDLGEYLIATLHRPDNTDDPVRLEEIFNALSIASSPIVLLAHPRLRARAAEFGISLDRENVMVRDPLSYPDLIAAVVDSRGVITDSGGLQKEAFLLRIPCTTIRTETEWPETLELGWNVLANSPADITAAVSRPFPSETLAAPYGTGNAASRVRQALLTTPHR